MGGLLSHGLLARGALGRPLSAVRFAVEVPKQVQGREVEGGHRSEAAPAIADARRVGVRVPGDSQVGVPFDKAQAAGGVRTVVRPSVRPLLLVGQGVSVDSALNVVHAVEGPHDARQRAGGALTHGGRVLASRGRGKAPLSHVFGGVQRCALDELHPVVGRLGRRRPVHGTFGLVARRVPGRVRHLQRPHKGVGHLGVGSRRERGGQREQHATTRGARGAGMGSVNDGLVAKAMHGFDEERERLGGHVVGVESYNPTLAHVALAARGVLVEERAAHVGRAVLVRAHRHVALLELVGELLARVLAPCPLLGIHARSFHHDESGQLVEGRIGGVMPALARIGVLRGGAIPVFH